MHSINTALIAIGCGSDSLEKAIAAAKRIGEVHVDQGETGCRTPDAASYIPKAPVYFASKARKATTAAGAMRKGPRTPAKAAAMAPKGRTPAKTRR